MKKICFINADQGTQIEERKNRGLNLKLFCSVFTSRTYA